MFEEISMNPIDPVLTQAAFCDFWTFGRRAGGGDGPDRPNSMIIDQQAGLYAIDLDRMG